VPNHRFTYKVIFRDITPAEAVIGVRDMDGQVAFRQLTVERKTERIKVIKRISLCIYG
jgi:hypothetical protein